MTIFFAKFFYATFFILFGLALIKYRRVIKSWTGDFYWAEKYLGRGGTYTALLLIGLFLIFYGTIYPFGGLKYLMGIKPKTSQVDYSTTQNQQDQQQEGQVDKLDGENKNNINKDGNQTEN